MSMPMSNIDKGGYVPPGYGQPRFGAGYPSAPSNQGPPQQVPPSDSIENQLFLFGRPAGYTPISQMSSYGEGQWQQPNFVGGPAQPGWAPPVQQPAYSPPMQPPFGPQSGPIMTQPGGPQPGPPMGPGGDWMSIPTGIPNCPPGLEYLTTVDQLLVKQKVELLEAFTGFETANKYSVKNALGQKVYHAIEENDCCTRNCCGPNRPFNMRIFDNFRNQVMHLYRPLACSSCCFPCCLQNMEVSAPPGNVIGSIQQEWTICSPSFQVKNQIGDTVLRIEGPFCTFSLCGDVEFNILSPTGENIGKISKQWSGFAREIFTDADFFGITFPMDLDVRMKGVLLGACFLIDYMFFEKQGNQERDGPGML